MAERTGTRASSRLNTPQSPPKVQAQQAASRRTTRAARSQSREVSDSETGKTKGKGGRRGTRQANASNGPGRKSKATAPATSNQVDPDLSVVPEDPNVENVEYPDMKPNFLEGLVQVATQANESPYSAFSGTTARTSQPSHILRSSSAIDLHDALHDLSDQADNVLHLLLPMEDVSEEAAATICTALLDTGSRTSKNVSRYGQAFDVHKSTYGAEPFLDIHAVLSTFLGSTENQGDGGEIWRPDPLLHKANLTTLVILVTRPWEVLASAHLAEILDQDFPAPFIGRFVNAEDFAMALEVRTQHFILQLIRYIHEINFDPDMLLSQIFQTNSTTFRGWNSLGLQTEELSDEQKQAIVSRFQELGQNFSEGRNVDPDVLRNAYPWNAFVTATMRWSKARLAEIENQISLQGGIEVMSAALSEEISERIAAGMLTEDGHRNDIQLEYPSPSQVSSAKLDKALAHKVNTIKVAQMRSEKLRRNSAKFLGHRVAQIKEMEKSLKKTPRKRNSQASQDTNPYNQQLTAAVAPMGTNSNIAVGGHAPTANMVPMTTSAQPLEGYTGDPLMENNWQPPQIEDNIQPNMDSVTFDDDFATTQRIVQMGEEREAAANKENVADSAHMQGAVSPGLMQREVLGPKKLGIMDHQPNAHRVEFDSQFPDTQGSSTGNKRDFETANMDAEADEIEPSQDQGFQEDNRIFDVAARRAEKPANKVLAPRKRAKKGRRATEPAPPPQESVQPETQAQGTEDMPSSTMGLYQESKARAQEFTSSQPKKVQVRKAWTDQETGLLLDLIEEHGTSWRLLKQIDEQDKFILKDRDQVALKDKARNMKLDFLKAGPYLPMNFEHVPLNKLQIQKLNDLGLEYNQDHGRRRRTVDA